MAITLTGTGGLFTRIGRLGGMLNSVNTFRGTTAVTSMSNIEAQYLSNWDYLSNPPATLLGFQNSCSGLLSSLQQWGNTTVIAQVNADVKQPNLLINTALQELITQMAGAGASVSRNTITLSNTSQATYGDGVMNLQYLPSTTTPCLPNGGLLQNCFAELAQVTCTQDSQTGGTDAGNEVFVYAGDYQQPNKLWFNWPLGSGVSATMRAIDGSADYPSGINNNLLVNSDFETFTVANVPDNWVVLSGTPGTSILSSNTHYTGAKSLNIVTTTNSRLYQIFNDSSGTTAQLQPLTGYALAVWLKVDAIPANGIVTIQFTDGSNTLLQDETGNGDIFQFTVSTIPDNTNWHPYVMTFRTPAVLPDEIRLQIGCSSLSVGSNLYIDHLSCGPLTQLYPMGPSMAIHSGASNFYLNDYFDYTATNNYNAGFQQLFEKFFNMASYGLQLPNAASPTISDSLIA